MISFYLLHHGRAALIHRDSNVISLIVPGRVKLLIMFDEQELYEVTHRFLSFGRQGHNQFCQGRIDSRHVP